MENIFLQLGDLPPTTLLFNTLGNNDLRRQAFKMILFLVLFLFMCVCLEGWFAYAREQVHRNQKEAQDAWELSHGELEDTSHGCWKRNLGPLEDKVLITTEHSAQLCDVFLF